MKLLVFIFSIYLFALPVLACAEKDNCADEIKTSITRAADHTQHEGETDGCGSFCDCTCCIHIVSVNIQSPVVIPGKPILENNMQNIYQDISLPSNYFGNIWQPPKLG